MLRDGFGAILKLQQFEGNADHAVILAAIEAQGAAVVHDFVSADLLTRLNADLDDAIALTSAGSKSRSPVWEAFHGANTKRFTGLAARSPAFVKLLQHPLMHVWARASLMQIAGDYWLNTGQAMIIGPGEQAQFLHRDQDNWPVVAAVGSCTAEITVSCMVALSDFKEEAGATRVVPGSHRWDETRQANTSETVAAEMPAGSALLYSGKVVHGGGANRTKDDWRRGLHMSFLAGWLTPEEAHPIAVPWNEAKLLPEAVQRLLGYGSHEPGGRGGGRLWLVDFDDARAALA